MPRKQRSPLLPVTNVHVFLLLKTKLFFGNAWIKIKAQQLQLRQTCLQKMKSFYNYLFWKFYFLRKNIVGSVPFSFFEPILKGILAGFFFRCQFNLKNNIGFSPSKICILSALFDSLFRYAGVPPLDGERMNAFQFDTFASETAGRVLLLSLLKK